MQHRRPNRVRSSAEVLAFDVRIEAIVGQRACTDSLLSRSSSIEYVVN